MSAANIARLTDRGVVSVTGRDSEKLLQGLITNDLEHVAAGSSALPGASCGAAFAAGQNPVRFFRRPGRRWLSARRRPRQSRRAGEAAGDVQTPGRRRDCRRVVPLHGIRGLGRRCRCACRSRTAASISPIPVIPSSASALLAEGSDKRCCPNCATPKLRIMPTMPSASRLGVPEGGKDYAFGDAYPHEANFDLLHGVSFTKGCYVGQEVVARMQNKTIVRKRVVKISAPATLTSGADVLARRSTNRTYRNGRWQQCARHAASGPSRRSGAEKPKAHRGRHHRDAGCRGTGALSRHGRSPARVGAPHVSTPMTITKNIERCPWAGAADTDYARYHDEEWGVPMTDDRALFEKLVLEGFQAGLSWLTILRKRENFRKAFHNFDAVAHCALYRARHRASDE